MIIQPELLLESFIRYSLDYARNNYDSHTDKEDTYLYDIFGDSKVGEYKFLDNAVALLNRDDTHPRKIEVHLFFNKERFVLPTIHIGLPSENLSSDNGVGYDYMWGEPGIDQVTHNKTFETRSNIIVTSDNTFEVLLMYRFLQAVLVGNIEELELRGLQNCRVTGGDIRLDETIAPMNVYSRGLFIDYQYNVTAPRFTSYGVINPLIIEKTGLYI